MASNNLTVSVADPQKMGDGLNAYISYKISAAWAERPTGLDASSFTVIRRFSDFVWLRDALHEAVPWVVVPALPEKQQLGRFNTDFVEIRHRALQRWMARVIDIPDLATSDPVKKFLSYPAEALAGLRDTSRTDLVKGVAEQGKQRFLKLLKTATNTITATIAEVRGTAGASVSSAASGATKGRSGEDEAFAAVELYLLGQAPLITMMYNAAAALAVRYREQAQLLLDSGAALRSLGTSEGAGGAMGGAVSSVGLSTWAASTSAYEQAVQETELWVERLADHVRGIRATREAVLARAAASAALAEALSEAERLHALVAALSASPAPTPQVITQKAAAEAELSAAQAAVTAARSHYDRVAAGLLEEVQRLREVNTEDFRSMLLDFATIQIRNNAKLGQAWERIVNDVDNAVVAEGGVPPPPLPPYTPPVPGAAIPTPVSSSSSSSAATGVGGGFVVPAPSYAPSYAPQGSAHGTSAMAFVPVSHASVLEAAGLPADEPSAPAAVPPAPAASAHDYDSGEHNAFSSGGFGNAFGEGSGFTDVS